MSDPYVSPRAMLIAARRDIPFDVGGEVNSQVLAIEAEVEASRAPEAQA